VSLQKDEARLGQRIEKGSNDSAEIAIKLREHADETMEKIGNESAQVTRYFAETSKLTVDTSNTIAKYAKTALQKSIESAEFYFWILTALFIITGAVGSYAIYVFLPGDLWWFVIPWIALTGGTLWRTYGQKEKLKRYPPALDNEIAKLMTELTQRSTRVPQPQTNFSLVKRFVSTLSSAASEVAAAAVEVVPVAEKIIDHQNKRMRRDQFLEGFRYAIGRYGFPVDDQDINSVLRTRLWLLDDEAKWLPGAIAELRTVYPTVDESILRLCYYDFFEKNQSLEPLWKQIKDEDRLRNQLAAILVANKVILNGQLGENSIPALGKLLSRIPNFSLAIAETRAIQFFDKLTEFKSHCVTQLGFYGLRIITLRDSLLEWVPQSSDPETWRDDVLTFIGGKLLTMDPDIIRLLVKDGLGDSGKSVAWKRVVQDKKFGPLAKILAIERIHKQSSEFDDDTFLAHISLCVSSLGDEFSVPRIQSMIAELESGVLRVKKLVSNCADRYRIETRELEFAKTFVPLNLQSVESEFVIKAAETYNIDPALFQFLYETVTTPDLADDHYEEFVKNHLGAFSELLISRGFVPKGDFAPNIAALLKLRKSFELSNFMQLASLYEKLSSSSNSLSGFLELHHVRNSRSVSFDDLLRLCPPDSPGTFEAQLVSLAKYLLDIRFGSEVLDDKRTGELATAGTLLFLSQQNDPAFRPLCEAVYYMDFGSRVLYRHLIQAEERIGTEMATLRDAVDLTLKSEPNDPHYLHFEYFQSQLLKRELPRTASSMISVQIDDLRRDFQRAQENGLEKNVIENYLMPISDLLNEKINEEIVKDFLTTKVLSAYLVTVPKNFPGITFLTDEQDIIAEAGKKLADETKDESYLTLYRVDKGTGKSTRIGIVPFGMTFEEFATKFEKLFGNAVKLANARPSPSVHYPDPLPYYLVRIFPSEDALQEIMHRDDIETSPFGIVRDMVKDQVGAAESISLLSLLQRAGTSSLALKQVIESIIDHPKSNLGTLAGDVINNLLSGFPNTKKKFQGGFVDEQLFRVYGVEKLSSLCIKMTELMRTADKDTVAKVFKENLTKAVPGLDAELGPDNLQILVNALLRRMKGVGTAMKLEL
jgi:hypothetical protein